jgi:hypothetical protein
MNSTKENAPTAIRASFETILNLHCKSFASDGKRFRRCYEPKP